MNISIRKRMSLFWLMGMLVLILAFTVIFFSYFNRIYKERMAQDQWSCTASAAENAGVLMMNIRQNAYYLCCNEDLAAVLVNVQENLPVRQMELLRAVFSLNTGTPTAPLMQSAYPMLLLDGQFPVADAAKPFVLGRNLTHQHIYSSQGLSDEPWYRQTLALRGQTYAFYDERCPDYVFFSHLLRSTRIADPRYNENIGVVLYAMPTLRMNALLTAARLSEGTCALLLYGDTVMASTDPALFPIGQPADLALPAVMQQGSIVPYQWDKGLFTASRVKFQGDWQCVLLAPERSIVAQETPVYMLALMLLMLIAVMLIISFLLSRQVIRPITRLSGVMEQARDAEHMPQAAEPENQDEIAVLYQSYNAMRGRIQALSREAQEEQKKVIASELKMMQAQINPHFIYNTLDSISCSALMEGNDDIVTMVASLISILKYSINFSRATVPLREEINYLQDYIRIQQIRYSDGFEFVCDIPEEYMSVAVSPITLQPLVENALFHAENGGDKLRIRLYCEEEAGLLLIHVTDNGSRADASRINSILRSADPADGHGIGIRNVYRRVTLQSGGRGNLYYQNMPGGGLDAVILIPLEFAEEEAPREPAPPGP